MSSKKSSPSTGPVKGHRRSGRVAKPTQFYLSPQLSMLKWTFQEKEILLKGIVHHGIGDCKFLSKEILNGSKSPDQVKVFLSTQRRQYQKNCIEISSTEGEAPIDKWISTMETRKIDSGYLFSFLLSLIADHEKHPDPIYSEIYSALSKALNRQPIPLLSEGARNKLIQLIYNLKRSIEESLPALYSTIFSLESNRKFILPSEVPSTSSASELLSLLAESNPLGLPVDLWSIPK